jgi:hypothetical protein
MNISRCTAVEDRFPRYRSLLAVDSKVNVDYRHSPDMDRCPMRHGRIADEGALSDMAVLESGYRHGQYPQNSK